MSFHRSGSAAAVRRTVRAWRAAGESVAFVPTMGALHEGHRSLLRLARRRADRVVASIFVNPAQFGPGEDYARYPRPLRDDLRACREEGTDLCYTPSRESLYGEDHRTRVTVEGLSTVLEGESRPGHFDGVCLVVLKLLHVTEPDLLVLGKKDAQQVVVLERMIRDLDLPVRVVRAPVSRERDGLARSSRNVYLSEADRRAAPALQRGLRAARALALEGERSAARLKERVRRELRREPRVRLEYVAVVDAETLRPLKRVAGRVLVPAAVRLGPTRLIDNVEFLVKGSRS